MKANGGRLLDLWHVDFSARNESVRSPDPLRRVEYRNLHVYGLGHGLHGRF